LPSPPVVVIARHRSCNFEDFEHGSVRLPNSTSLSDISNHEKRYPSVSLLGLDAHSEDSVQEKAKGQGPYDEVAKSPSAKFQKIALESIQISMKSAGYQKLKDFWKQNRISTSGSSFPMSTASSRTSTSSFSSRKAYPGSRELGLDSSAIDGKNHRSAMFRPITRLLDSLSIPAVTPEGNESDLSETMENRGLTSGPTEFTWHDKYDSMGQGSEDDDSGMSPSPWLLNETEKILGPRYMNADAESLSGKSNRSLNFKLKRGRRKESEASYGSASQSSAHNVSSVMSAVSSSMSNDILEQTGGEIFFRKSKKSLESDKKRLEAQLAALENDIATTTSSITMTSIPGTSLSTLSARSKTKKRKSKIIVIAPAGKLGVILANRFV
jgi:hypothetical protein